jgi:DtxR family Mn-dependent transcriptional regulator
MSVEEGREVTSYSLAKEFSVRPPSSIDVLNRLSRKGLIVRKLWGSVMLTEEGLKVAQKLVHVHRVLEAFFYGSLGLSISTACSEASKLDHLISDEVALRLCKFEDKPSRCPHGYGIPHHRRCRR